MPSPTPLIVLCKGHRDTYTVVVFGANTKHVCEGSITLMSWSRVLAYAAGVGLVKVTAVGPTIVQIIVFASSLGGHRAVLVVAAVVGAIGRCLCWGCCKVLSNKGLGDVLLNHASHVRDQWADGGASDGALE